MKKIMKKSLRKMGIGLIIMAIVFVSSPMTITNAASQLTNVEDTLTRLKISEEANHTVVFTTTDAVANGDDIVITFPAGFLLTDPITEDDVDISGSTFGELTTGADCSLTEHASVTVAGQVLTINLCNGDGASFNASETVTIEVGTNATASGTGTNQITNPGTSGLKEMILQTETGATVDQDAQLGIYILSDDQVQISATVDPILAFAIEGGYQGSEPAAVDFGTLIPNFYHKLLGEKPAYAGILFAGQPVEDESIEVHSQTYTFKDTEDEANAQSYFVLIGDNFDDTAENLYRAINNTDGDNVRAGLDNADVSQVWFVVSAAGTAGDDYTMTESIVASVTLTDDAGTFINGQAGSNYRDDNLGFGETDGTLMGNESEGTNLVISTNAVGGYVITVQDNTNGLYNTGAGWGIPDWLGQYGFGIWAKARNAKYGECDPSAPIEIIAEAYDVDAGGNPGTLTDSVATLASYSGPTSKDHISIEYVVRIDADYPAGNYSDTLTYIATSTF